MRPRIWSAALVALALVSGSCSDNGTTNPTARHPGLARFSSSAALPAVRISEIHYDNTGTDAGEAIEVSGPAGTDLTGWQLVLYNGSGGARYDTTAFTGTIAASCGGRGVVVTNYPVNGIQNGDPDGLALVDAGGTVIEFLSYEGTFAATDGPANGTTSSDIGSRETGTEPLGQSLQRNGNGVWSNPIASTFGVCNDDEVTPPAEVASVSVTPASATVVVGATQAFTATALDATNQPVADVAFTWSAGASANVDASGLATGIAAGDAEITATAPNGVRGTATLHVIDAPPPPTGPVRISEIHYDNSGTDVGEAVEVEGPAGTDLTGWRVVLYNGNGGTSYGTLVLSGVLANTCSGHGMVSVAAPGIQNGSPDGLALVNAAGTVVEFLSYEGGFAAADGPAAGMISTDIGVAQDGSSPAGQSLQRNAEGVWYGLAPASFGGCNVQPPPPSSAIVFSGRTAGDPALPVGFEDQLFATLRNGNVTMPTTFTWSSDTPAIASIDQDGVFRALAEGTATLRATAADGTTATYSLPTRVATASGTTRYEGNAEFGEPADGTPGDDFIVRRAQYVTSFNPTRGTPNWVSYELDPTHYGPEDRCDCFTFDPQLPSTFTHYTTADYTGAGAFHGYGIDRGHLARSFDRTAGALDNATTFYFSNIVPQAADLNQGPWAALETYLGDLVRFQNKEVYVVAGVAGSKGTIKNEGKITIPASTWKVAVVMGHDQGLSAIHDSHDVEVIAVNMPNEPGVRNVIWQTYRTTVDAVEALSGYDLLALLPDGIERIVESGIDAPDGTAEGTSIALSAVRPSDAATATYQWNFGDGQTATGTEVSHTFANDGVYTIHLEVLESGGLRLDATTTVTVANVAPAITTFAGATLLPGESYIASGSFGDPGADSWTATVDYGDGSGRAALPLAGKTFSLAHRYTRAGSFTVTVTVSDDDVTSTRTQAVKVQSQQEAVSDAIGLAERLVSGGEARAGNGNSLVVKLQAASRQLSADGWGAAANQLESALNELDAMERSGRLSPDDARALRTLIVRIVRSISS